MPRAGRFTVSPTVGGAQATGRVPCQDSHNLDGISAVTLRHASLERSGIDAGDAQPRPTGVELMERVRQLAARRPQSDAGIHAHELDRRVDQDDLTRRGAWDRVDQRLHAALDAGVRVHGQEKAERSEDEAEPDEHGARDADESARVVLARRQKARDHAERTERRGHEQPLLRQRGEQRRDAADGTEREESRRTVSGRGVEQRRHEQQGQREPPEPGCALGIRNPERRDAHSEQRGQPEGQVVKPPRRRSARISAFARRQ